MPVTKLAVKVQRFHVLGQGIADALVTIVDRLCKSIDEKLAQTKTIDPMQDIKFNDHAVRSV